MWGLSLGLCLLFMYLFHTHPQQPGPTLSDGARPIITLGNVLQLNQVSRLLF